MSHLRSLTLALGLSVACSGKPAQPAPQPSEHALSGLAAQRVAVLPTYTARVAPELNWSAGKPAELKATMDADIVAALEERGLNKIWILPAELVQNFRRNPTYATDPYRLAVEPLRLPSLAADARLAEPLASQIRTLVAFQQEARYVLAPVELRLEPAGAKGGRGVLRLVLMDARLSNVRWIGEIASDTLSSFSPAISASLAARLAAVIAPR